MIFTTGLLDNYLLNFCILNFKRRQNNLFHVINILQLPNTSLKKKNRKNRGFITINCGIYTGEFKINREVTIFYKKEPCLWAVSKDLRLYSIVEISYGGGIFPLAHCVYLISFPHQRLGCMSSPPNTGCNAWMMSCMCLTFWLTSNLYWIVDLCVLKPKISR